MSNFKLTKTFRFEASHQLPNHDGKCARLHGHSWVGAVVVSGSTLKQLGPKAGMLIDYSELKKIVEPIVSGKLDHWHLNDSLGLEAPTSEVIARWLFNELKPLLSGYLEAVIIEETCTSRCEYSE